MISQAPDVDTYIEQLPPDRKPTFLRLRDLYRKVFVGYEECIDYGMPCYRLNGELGPSFASQKQYISLYGLRKQFDELAPEIATASKSKGCIRFSRPEKLDFLLLEKILRRKFEVNANPR